MKFKRTGELIETKQGHKTYDEWMASNFKQLVRAGKIPVDAKEADIELALVPMSVYKNLVDAYNMLHAWGA